MLGRGEKLDQLAEKTRDLDQQAFIFHSETRSLKNRMWWQNARVTALIVVLVIVILLILIVAACGGFSFSRCRK